MSQFFIKTIKRLALVCASVFVLSTGVLHAEPYFIHKDSAMVLDKATGLVWMRCSLGQTWAGRDCVGEANRFTYRQALSAAQANRLSGHTDWRLPTARELQALRACSTGLTSRKVDIEDGGDQVSAECNNNAVDPPIGNNTFPSTPTTGYWTSSPSVRDSSNVWVVGFYGGTLLSLRGDEYTLAVRLVRAVKKFPTNEYALKSSDQLNAMNRSERQSSSGQQANQRQICESQKQSCLASCGTQSVHNGREYVSNWSYGPCTQRCNQINCN